MEETKILFNIDTLKSRQYGDTYSSRAKCIRCQYSSSSAEESLLNFPKYHCICAQVICYRGLPTLVIRPYLL